MRAFVFLGPSLPRSALPPDPRLVPLPPASQGDLLALLPERPGAVGVVDGRFEGVPALLHKEILHAMSEGVPIVGGASIGALRAAELHAFGMRGVGRIFQACRDGGIEADDEVAVLHGPEEAGYLPLSTALVNLRATLERAWIEGIVDARTTLHLLGLAQARFYKERTADALFRDAAAAGVEAPGLRAWWATNAVDLKAADAKAVVRATLEALDAPPSPPRPFVWTGAYAALAAEARFALTLDERLAYDELRLRPADYARLRDRALPKALAAEGRARAAPDDAPDDALGRAAAGALRRRLGLGRGADFRAWCADQGLDEAGFARVALGGAAVEAAAADPPLGFARRVLDEARLEGCYRGLAARGRDKRARLVDEGLPAASAAGLGLDPLGPLLAFAGEGVADLSSWLRAQGFRDVPEASRLVVGERLYKALVERDEHREAGPEG
ncbi:MAG: hypothetical protein KDG89_06035 [Geminicoccaceae bacterium]|nr:hypothetical protein [Geminicoccaceae bacterium]